MKLYEDKLKKIIAYIEQFGAIKDVKIINSSILLREPIKSKVIEFDLNKPNEYEIRFILGNEKIKKSKE